MKHLFGSVRQKVMTVLRGKSVYYKRSYSQMAEDMIVSGLLYNSKGFYVDVGAYHPWRFSNTYHFYRKGWKGINIDGSAEAIKLLQRKRKRDISLQLIIGPENKTLNFYEFHQRELNTTVSEELPAILQFHGQKPIRVSEVKCMSLGQLLNQYLPSGQSIDLLNIDAEGADEEIIRSNDWSRYRPKVIIVERHCKLEDFLASDFFKFLGSNDYKIYGFCKHAFILTEEKAPF
ncbi:MAG TPA: FkbM family methyltransferase [Flavipsychrobacter sp.]|nr:FkbM family methyltransferase [Flavipsychrobacter sp.]